MMYDRCGLNSNVDPYFYDMYCSVHNNIIATNSFDELLHTLKDAIVYYDLCSAFLFLCTYI